MEQSENFKTQVRKLVNSPVPQTANAAENGGKTPLLLAIEKQNDDVVKRPDDAAPVGDVNIGLLTDHVPRGIVALHLKAAIGDSGELSWD